MNEGARPDEWNRLQEELQHLVDARLADRTPRENGSQRTDVPDSPGSPRPHDAVKTAEPSVTRATAPPAPVKAPAPPVQQPAPAAPPVRRTPPAPPARPAIPAPSLGPAIPAPPEALRSPGPVGAPKPPAAPGRTESPTRAAGSSRPHDRVVEESRQTSDEALDYFGRSTERRPYVGKRVASLRTRLHQQLVDRVKELEEEVLRLGIRSEVAESSLDKAERHYEERLQDLRLQLWASQTELDEERERSRVSSRAFFPRLFGR